jgi:cation diffusion facilitator family transporter
VAESKTAVYGAIAANVAIAATKFIVAALSGSSVMFAEGIHSTVDAGNGLLLLVGLRASQRAPSPKHPFGYGKELFFWSLIVAVLIFGVGGGLSAYEGVMHILHPHPLVDAFWAYVVLAVAAIFEGASLAVALRAFFSEKGERPFWDALYASKDPATYTVVAEDGAALLGLAIAAVGVWINARFRMPIADGIASVLIGMLLAGVAIVLIREARGLLVGEGIRPETAAEIRRLVLADSRTRAVGPILSMYIGPSEVLLTLDVEFDPTLPADEIAKAVNRIEHDIREQYPKIERIYIETRALRPHAKQDSKLASAPS